MTTWVVFSLIISIFHYFSFDFAISSSQYVGQIKPGFQTTQIEWVDHNGMFLVSNNSEFSFGFYPSVDAPFFVLVVMHLFSSTIIWTANRGLLVDNSDKFVFDTNGNAYLANKTSLVWSTYTARQDVRAMELKDNGDLVLMSMNQTMLWQSFEHPTDTLIVGQRFYQGTRLKSFPDELNLFYYLEIKYGDVILFAGYETPQVYWSMSNDSRKSVKKAGGLVSSATLMGNSWDFYDQRGDLVWQFNISDEFNSNALWVAVLGSTGSIGFYNLLKGKSEAAESKIPQRSCSTPSSCTPYKSCFNENLCQCPLTLRSFHDCKPPTLATCRGSGSSLHLLDVGPWFDYPALGFTKPQLKANLSGCKDACLRNCSCMAMFYENGSRSCFMFSQIGSLRHPDVGASGYYLSLKVSNDGDEGLTPSRGHGRVDGRSVLIIIIIAIGTILIVFGLVGCGFWYYLENKGSFLESPSGASEEDSFFENIQGMPVRYSYGDLHVATKGFSMKLGQGGFGSVYLGLLGDGTKIAVKKLEGVGQGRREFRAEVSIIGSVHHVHLARLKGFCAEGAHHRLLVYDFMENGSLDRWIFNKSEPCLALDWLTRFNIALGMAKGLAYLHEECDVKIIHCDIKPENVLLDANFVAKVSDFGLAKLMNREQSQVITTLRGTRGYLAPEWITNCTLSEKSDVYSYGMVLLEIIGGRKNFDPNEISEKVHFPSYAFRMMEKGSLSEIFDPRLKLDECDEGSLVSIIRVALWCVQEDISLRPPMTKVVQMLEGLSPVPQPPVCSHSTTRIFSGMLNSSGQNGTLSWAGNNSIDTSVSAVQLSGPR